MVVRTRAVRVVSCLSNTRPNSRICGSWYHKSWQLDLFLCLSCQSQGARGVGESCIDIALSREFCSTRLLRLFSESEVVNLEAWKQRRRSMRVVPIRGRDGTQAMCDVISAKSFTWQPRPVVLLEICVQILPRRGRH